MILCFLQPLDTFIRASVIRNDASLRLSSEPSRWPRFRMFDRKSRQNDRPKGRGTQKELQA
jgi:hypothetical protein